jgi:type II secretory pathway pseudopilin PulG
MRSAGLTSRRSLGFSFVELLIVVAVIVLLTGMLMEAFNIMRRQAKKVQTKTLMGQVETALEDYLKQYPLLGNTADQVSSDFVASPWTFLGRNMLSAGQIPYLPVQDKFLAVGSASGPWTAGSQSTGDQILDGFITSDFSNHLIWSIMNGPAAGPFTYTDKIYIRSAVGTPANPNDDLVSRFTLINGGQWTDLSYTLAEQDSPAPW